MCFKASRGSFSCTRALEGLLRVVIRDAGMSKEGEVKIKRAIGVFECRKDKI